MQRLQGSPAQGCGLHSARAVKATGPVGQAHALDPDLSAGFGGVDELAFTNVNAHVAEGASHGVEKHEVAGLELAAVNRLSG